MTDRVERHRLAGLLFAELADADPAVRAEILEARAGEDPELVREVVAMLDAEARVDVGEDPLRRSIEVAAHPLVEAEFVDGIDPMLGSQLGGYRIERLIARGGMGRVYEARQDSPQRTVAVKILDLRILSRAALARFRNEADLMARLVHAGIAQIYEVGTQRETAGATPWFAMELVPNAAAITDAVRERHLALRARIELFLHVCDAVHFGHGRGIVHRDIKPSNVLIDREAALPHPKIIDFGIARSTDADITLATQRTEVGQIVGTLPYMSPEQLAGDVLAIDVRTDVYSLGLLLYEILTDRCAFDISGIMLPQALRLLSTTIPQRMRDVAPGRSVELTGDIETIVTKAIERDLSRRYASVAEFAQDLRRYLAHEPISARPPSVVYTARLFARRHRAIVWGVTATMAALVIGIVGTVVGLVRANRGEADADRARSAAEAARDQAEFDAYVANIMAAEAALRTDDVRLARQRLYATPPERRDWEWRHLRARLDRSQTNATFEGAPRAVLRYTRDGTGLIYADATGATRLLDAKTLEARWTMHDSPREPLDIAISPDGARVAIVHDRVGVAVIDIASHALVAACNIPWAKALAFADSNDAVVVAGRDGAIGRWEFATSAPIKLCGDYVAESGLKDCAGIAVEGHGGSVVVASDSGMFLVNVASSAVSRLHSRRAVDGARIVPIAKFSGDGACVAMILEGRELVVCRLDGSEKRSSFLAGQVCSVAWTFDDSAVMISRSSGDTTLHDAQSLAPIRRLVGHEFPISWVASTAVGSSGPQTASVDWTGVVRTWSPTSNDILHHQASRAWIYDVAFAPDNSWFAVSIGEAPGGEPLSASFQTQSGQRRWVSEVPAHPSLIFSLAVTSDGRSVIHPTGEKGGGLHVRDAATGALERVLPTPSLQGLRTARIRPGHGECVDVGPGDKASLLALDDGRLIRTFPMEHVNELALSADGRLLALSPRPETGIVVYALDDGSERVRLATQAYVSSSTFSPDGSMLAARCADGTITTWSTTTWAVERSWKGEGPWGYQIAFDPGGGRLFGRVYRGIRVWDPKRGVEILTLSMPSDASHGFSFSPDGTWLGVGCTDGSVVLLDAPNMEESIRAR